MFERICLLFPGDFNPFIYVIFLWSHDNKFQKATASSSTKYLMFETVCLKNITTYERGLSECIISDS